MNRFEREISVPGGIKFRVLHENTSSMAALDILVDGRMRAGAYMKRPELHSLVAALTEALARIPEASS